MNLYDFLMERAAPDARAIVTKAGITNYAALQDLALTIAGMLRRHGIRKGDRVGIIDENSEFWAASYLGVLNMGGVAVPFPIGTSVAGIAQLLGLVPCRAYCIGDKRLHRVRSLLPSDALVVTLTDVGSPNRTGDGSAGAPRSTPVDEAADLAALMFTSGSEGQPTPVMVTHLNIITNTNSILKFLPIGPDDCMFTILPFEYCFGASLLHTHLRVGASVAVENSFHFLEEALSSLEAWRCTGLAGVPHVFDTLLSVPELGHRLRTLRHVQQAGGHLSAGTLHEFVARVPRAQFFVMYGQTEATARLSYLPPDRIADKAGSVGRAIPDVTLRVLDESGSDLPFGLVGEIVAAGDNVTLGYLHGDSRLRFRDGLLHTGDLGYTDDEGFIYITGRMSRFVKIHGYRVSCPQVEDVVRQHPDVLDVAVDACADHTDTQELVAFLVTKSGDPVSANDLRGTCKAVLPRYAWPTRTVALPHLPRTLKGTVARARLKELLDASAAGDLSDLDRERDDVI